jgi:hypothetical protein
MQVEVTTDGNIDGTGGFISDTEGEVKAVLARHLDSVTRVEVHLGDENGGKGGSADKRCTVEARPEGRRPVAVTHHAASTAEALRGALQKLARLLERQAGKGNGQKGGPSIRHLEADVGIAGA